jgi:hypothetical protein
MADEPSRVQLADVTEAAFSGVLRALEARKLTPDKFPGPILVGIIAWPELTKVAEQAGKSLPGG